jgi:diaminopimelate epimerase
MRHAISFVKASGAGNDFVVIDNYDGHLELDQTRLARALCDRHFGIGADGLLILQHCATAHFQMLYYNADGSHGGMCGNGGRCIARFAYLKGLAPARMRFQALEHIYEAEIVSEEVRLKMKDPVNYRKSLQTDLDGGSFLCHFVDTGSPHAVVVVDDLDSIDVVKTGRALRFHRLFSPEGANINFLDPQSGNTIAIRTYERGVETETLACGTGSVASAIVAVLEQGLSFPVTVKARSGEELIVDAQLEGSTITNVYLQGSARILFTGMLVYDSASDKIESLTEFK